MTNAPGVILTCQFTLPSKQSFGKYIDYITREAALNGIVHRSPAEESELLLVQAGLENYEVVGGEKIIDSPSGENRTDTLQEAKLLLKKGLDFERLETEGFNKYLSYMTRQSALESKEKLSSTEEKELNLLSKKINSYNKSTTEKTSGILPGVFSVDADTLTSDDFKFIKNKFERGQRHGSVIYQDVISHDNNYLETIGLYNSSTKKLDERGLVSAGNKMMEELFKQEKLQDTGIWMASIHRNTDHIHIHFAVVEKENTRPLFYKKSNEEVSLLPKGKRKQSTLDKMKTSYVQELERYAGGKNKDIALKKTQLLTRKSDLRNLLTQQVKQTSHYDDEAISLLKQLHASLPDKQSDWNYGSESKTKLRPEAKEILDCLTKHLLTQTPDYEEYIDIANSLQKEAQMIYGDSQNQSKQVDQTAMFDLQKRTGNAILTSLKNQDSQLKHLLIDQAAQKIINSQAPFQTIANDYPPAHKTPDRMTMKKSRYTPMETINTLASNKISINYENFQKIRVNNDFQKISYSAIKKNKTKYSQASFTRKSLNQIKKSVNNSEEKYQSMRVYEEQQRRIQMEQNR